MPDKRVDAYAPIDSLSNSDEFLVWDSSASAVKNASGSVVAKYASKGFDSVKTVGFSDRVDFRVDGAGGVIDDSTVVQQAIDSGALVLEFEAGIYSFGSELVIPKEAHITFRGQQLEKGFDGDGVVFRAGVTYTNLMSITGNINPTTNADLAHQVIFENIVFDGGSKTTNILLATNADFIVFDRCRLIGSTNSIKTVWDSTTDPNSATIPGGIFISNSFISANEGGDGIVFDHQTQCWISDCWFTSGTGTANSWLKVKSSNKLHISNVEFNTVNQAILFEDTATFPTTDITINGAVFAVGLSGKLWTDNRTNSSSDRVIVAGSTAPPNNGFDVLVGQNNEIKGNPGVYKSFTVATDGSGDYNCDGVDDHVQIQAAVDAANTAGGGTVRIKAGTYTLGGRVLIANRNNVTIVGDGIDATILNNYGFYKNDATSTENMHFRDFTININNTAGENAINLVNKCKDFTMTRVKLLNTNNRFLLHWSLMDNFVARDCIFIDGGLTVGADNCAGSQDPSTEGTSKFVNCDFIATAAKAGGGLLTTGQTGNLIVQGCSFDNEFGTTYAAISLEHQTGNSKNFVCDSNYMYRCGVQTSVSGKSNTTESVVISNNIIKGTVALDESGGGIIKVQDAKRATVTGNVLNEVEHGIFVTGSGAVTISSNVVEDTNFANNATDFNRGSMYISGNEDVVISNNVLSDATGTSAHGIKVVSIVNTADVSGNTFKGTFTGGKLLTDSTADKLKSRNNRGYSEEYTAKTAAYTLTKANESGVVDFTGTTTANATLPTSGNVTGDTYTIKNSGTGTITVVGTIDGATNDSLQTKESGVYTYNGTSWIRT